MSGTTIYIGEDRAPNVTVKDATGTAIDMTVSGRSLVLRLRRIGTTGSPELTLSPTWSNQAGGIGTFVFSPAVTAALSQGKYWLEVCYYATADSVKRLMYGPEQWTVKPSETGGP